MAEDAIAELNRAVRAVIEKVRVTTAPDELASESARVLQSIADDLAPYMHEGTPAQAGLDEGGPYDMVGASPAASFPYSPVVGSRNPISPPIDFRVTEAGLEAEHVFTAAWAGPPGAVHGGIVALVFDELLGSTNVVADVGAYTGTLSVRYHIPTPLGVSIRMLGTIVRQEGRKVMTEGKMWAGDTLTAEAEGIFILPREMGPA